MSKFKPGDIVRYTEERQLAFNSKSAHVGATARVRNPPYHGIWLQVAWIANPLPDQNPISQQDGGYGECQFELAPPPSFTLKLPTYKDVDEATELATRIATRFNIPVEVLRV